MPGHHDLFFVGVRQQAEELDETVVAGDAVSLASARRLSGINHHRPRASRTMPFSAQLSQLRRSEGRLVSRVDMCVRASYIRI